MFMVGKPGMRGPMVKAFSRVALPLQAVVTERARVSPVPQVTLARTAVSDIQVVAIAPLTPTRARVERPVMRHAPRTVTDMAAVDMVLLGNTEEIDGLAVQVASSEPLVCKTVALTPREAPQPSAWRSLREVSEVHWVAWAPVPPRRAR